MQRFVTIWYDMRIDLEGIFLSGTIFAAKLMKEHWLDRPTYFTGKWDDMEQTGSVLR